MQIAASRRRVRVGRPAVAAALLGDGVGVLDVRGAFRADDDSIVYVHYQGYAHSQTAEGSLFFRTQPRFETASEKYGPLNRILSVGIGRPQPPESNQLKYDIFENPVGGVSPAQDVVRNFPLRACRTSG